MMWLNHYGSVRSVPFCSTNQFFNADGFCQDCQDGYGTVYFQQPTCMACYDMPYKDISSIKPNPFNDP
jgi:hypothetical protein